MFQELPKPRDDKAAGGRWYKVLGATGPGGASKPEARRSAGGGASPGNMVCQWHSNTCASPPPPPWLVAELGEGCPALWLEPTPLPPPALRHPLHSNVLAVPAAASSHHATAVGPPGVAALVLLSPLSLQPRSKGFIAWGLACLTAQACAVAFGMQSGQPPIMLSILLKREKSEEGEGEAGWVHPRPPTSHGITANITLFQSSRLQPHLNWLL